MLCPQFKSPKGGPISIFDRMEAERTALDFARAKPYTWLYLEYVPHFAGRQNGKKFTGSRILREGCGTSAAFCGNVFPHFAGR